MIHGVCVEVIGFRQSQTISAHAENGKKVLRMGEMMQFPKRWEDFLHDYEFEDTRRIYTNGSRLIPSFRVKQMMEHYAPVRHGRWEIVDGSNGKEYMVCTECRVQQDLTGVFSYCPNCGAMMDGENNGEQV